MTIVVHAIPYDSGHRAARMGAGPLHILDHGRLLARLRAHDGDVQLRPLETDAAFATEIGTAFELHRALARAVAEATAAGALPLVLSGNCNSSIGTVAGLAAAAPGMPVGVLWFDGHGDCNTPETFTGDFLDAMGLSTLTGRCWQALSASVPGFEPVPDPRVALVGAHGADAGALGILAASAITCISPAVLRSQGPAAAIAAAVDRLAQAGARRLYVHLDVDVLDPKAAAPANGFAPPGGLTPAELATATNALTHTLPIAAAAVASYDPSYDLEDRVLSTALAFLEAVAESWVRRPGTAAAGQA